MTTDHARMTEHELGELDDLLGIDESRRWHAFFQDRARQCPFFVPFSDESFAQWVCGGVIRFPFQQPGDMEPSRVANRRWR